MRRRTVPKGGNRRQPLPAVSDRSDAEADQVIGRQLGQNVAVDDAGQRTPACIVQGQAGAADQRQ